MLYIEISNKDQLDTEFTQGAFMTMKLVGVKCAGESIHVYANRIKQLTILAGFMRGELKHVVKMAFVNWFPTNISTALQQLSGIDKHD